MIDLPEGTVLRDTQTGQRAEIIFGVVEGGGYYGMRALDQTPDMRPWQREFPLQPGHVGRTWLVENQPLVD